MSICDLFELYHVRIMLLLQRLLKLVSFLGRHQIRVHAHISLIILTHFHKETTQKIKLQQPPQTPTLGSLFLANVFFSIKDFGVLVESLLICEHSEKCSL